MEPHSRIFVAGHRGLVGSALVRHLQESGFTNLILRERRALDLREQSAVREFFHRERPEHVFVVAGLVGGIAANAARPADFLFDNLMIAANVIHAAAAYDTEKLLYLGSSCVYPRESAQPITESALLSGPLESTNEGYAVAKIAGLKLCEMYHRQYGRRFISAMPTNLYGPGDYFHPTDSHVVPGMMRRFHEAKVEHKPEVVVWGSGRPRREFLHVDDLAAALLLLMRSYEDSVTINVGTGSDLPIAELAALMRDVVRYPGRIVFDVAKPDGTPRKLLDVSRIEALGWKARIPLRDGLRSTYEWASENIFAAERAPAT
jgi:GDP-L-fucose synthase